MTSPPAGDRLVNTAFDVRFRVDKEDDILCMRELTLAEMQKLRKAVAQEYYFQARQLGAWVSGQGELGCRKKICWQASCRSLTPPTPCRPPAAQPSDSRTCLIHCMFAHILDSPRAPHCSALLSLHSNPLADCARCQAWGQAAQLRRQL